jgi:hypothetical protein
MTRIREECGCGAWFEVDTPIYAHATSAAATWRKDHRHPVPNALPLRLPHEADQLFGKPTDALLQDQ